MTSTLLLLVCWAPAWPSNVSLVSQSDYKCSSLGLLTPVELIIPFLYLSFLFLSFFLLWVFIIIYSSSTLLVHANQPDYNSDYASIPDYSHSLTSSMASCSDSYHPANSTHLYNNTIIQAQLLYKPVRLPRAVSLFGSIYIGLV